MRTFAVMLFLCVAVNLLCEAAGWHVRVDHLGGHALRGGFVFMVVMSSLWLVRVMVAH